MELLGTIYHYSALAIVSAFLIFSILFSLRKVGKAIWFFLSFIWQQPYWITITYTVIMLPLIAALAYYRVGFEWGVGRARSWTMLFIVVMVYLPIAAIIARIEYKLKKRREAAQKINASHPPVEHSTESS